MKRGKGGVDVLVVGRELVGVAVMGNYLGDLSSCNA